MGRSSRVCIIVIFLTALACGGGGGGSVGGGSTGGTLTYISDWTQASNTNGGKSQRITVLDGDGKSIRSIVQNDPGGGRISVQVENLPTGDAIVLAELFSGSNATGARVGEVRSPVTLNPSQTLEIAVGGQVASVEVLPNSSSIEIPRSRRFYAVAKTASGTTTFATSAFQWSATGSAGPVDSQGLATPTLAGSGTVRASIGSPPITGSSTVTVSNGNIRRGKWTILVYMNAASDLHPYSLLNFNQIERVANNPDVRFVLQWKQAQSLYPNSTFDGTRRYLARYDTGSGIASDLIQNLGTGVDMGKPQTLKEFVSWATTYYPADHTCLVVWSHGNGWRRRPDAPFTRAVSYDDETGSAIQIWELSQALTGQHVDILAWDASLMQMMEVAYEARPYADFVVGSEESPPGEGYPYDGVFAAFANAPDAAPRDLAKSFVNATLAVPSYANRKITQSVVETANLGALERAIDALAGKLMSSVGVYDDAYRDARSTAQAYSPNGSRYYRDLYGFCERLEELTDLDPWCVEIRNKLADAVIWEGHNAQSPGSHGLSIDVTPGITFLPNATDYGRMQFGKDNRWDDWLVTAP